MAEINITTEEDKKRVKRLFMGFNKKGDILKYYNLRKTPKTLSYINSILIQIGLGFYYYKEKKKRHCLVCGKELKKGQYKFCSKSCSVSFNNSKRKHSEETKQKISKSLCKNKKELKICKICGNEYYYDHKKNFITTPCFCSMECLEKYRKKPYLLDTEDAKRKKKRRLYKICRKTGQTV